MGVVPAQGRNGLGTIRGTSQLTDFRGLFRFLPMKTEAKLDLDMLVVFLVAFGLWGGAPGVTDGYCTTPRGGRARTNQINHRWQIIGDCSPLYPWKKNGLARTGYMVFFVALGLWGGPPGWRLGDVPPQEGDEVGLIRRTSQVTDFRWLYSSLPKNTAANWDLDILVVF